MAKILKTPLKTSMASPNTIVRLMVIGALQVGENGLCVSEPGIYPKKGKIPTQTANPSGDE